METTLLVNRILGGLLVLASAVGTSKGVWTAEQRKNAGEPFVGALIIAVVWGVTLVLVAHWLLDLPTMNYTLAAFGGLFGILYSRRKKADKLPSGARVTLDG